MPENKPIILSPRMAGKMNFASTVKYLLMNKKHVYVGAPKFFIDQIESFYPTLRKQVFTEDEWGRKTAEQRKMPLTYDEASKKVDNFDTP